MNQKYVIVTERNILTTILCPHKMATNPIYIFLFILILSFSSCSTTETISNRALSISNAHFQENKLTNDFFTLFPDSMIAVRSVHDEDSLHIEVITKDYVRQRSMLINGVSIWIDFENEKKMSHGITFPAARAVMRKQSPDSSAPPAPGEKPEETVNKNDSVRPPKPPPFDVNYWVKRMNQENVVVKDTNGTRFDRHNQGRIKRNESNLLIYSVHLGWDQFNTNPSELKKFSVGIISDPPRMIQNGSAQQSSMGTPRDPYGRPLPRRPDPSTDVKRGIPQVSINKWITYYLDLSTYEKDLADSEKSDRKVDDVY